MDRDLDWKPVMYLAADLLNNLMQFDHTKRLSPQEMLDHPFLKAAECEFVGLDHDYSTKRLFKPCTFKPREPIVIYRGM